MNLEGVSFSRVAKSYDRVTAKATSRLNGAVIQAAGIGRGMKLLDVACGSGRLLEAASKLGIDVEGVDCAESMLSIARLRCPEAQLHQGTAETLPFEEGRFDAVTCCFGLLHFKDPDKAMKEAFRVLKPGGRYVFVNWAQPGENIFMSLVQSAIKAHAESAHDMHDDSSLFRFGCRVECMKALRRAGFSVMDVFGTQTAWTFSSPEEILPDLMAGTASISSMISRQTESVRLKIEKAIVDGAKDFSTKKGTEIPAGVVLAVAAKPSPREGRA